MQFCLLEGLLVAVENTASSLFWRTSFWQTVGHSVMRFDALMALIAIVLNVKPWCLQDERWVETEYPSRLCQAVALVFVHILENHSVAPPPQTLQVLREFATTFMTATRATQQQGMKPNFLPLRRNTQERLPFEAGPGAFAFVSRRCDSSGMSEHRHSGKRAR